MYIQNCVTIGKQIKRTIIIHENVEALQSAKTKGSVVLAEEWGQNWDTFCENWTQTDS